MQTHVNLNDYVHKCYSKHELHRALQGDKIKVEAIRFHKLCKK